MDRSLVHRVLRHILENAARYSPAGSPIIIGASRRDDRLLITVADRGPGIDVGEQPFVFDKFFRGRKQQSQVGRYRHGSRHRPRHRRSPRRRHRARQPRRRRHALHLLAPAGCRRLNRLSKMVHAMTSRRTFLRNSAALLPALALAGTTHWAAADHIPLGVQLYTVRKEAAAGSPARPRANRPHRLSGGRSLRRPLHQSRRNAAATSSSTPASPSPARTSATTISTRISITQKSSASHGWSAP